MAANFIAVAARMSLVTFLGIYFVREAGVSLAVVGAAFLCESLARGLFAPLFGAWSDRIGRRRLLVVSALATAVVLPCFLLVTGPVSLVLWSLALGTTGSINMPIAGALLLDLAPPERRQAILAANYTAMSVAYTLGVMPAGYVAEHSYAILAAIAACGYVLIAVLYAAALRGPLPIEPARSQEHFFRSTLSAFSDRTFLRFASVGFVFPLAMGLVVSVSPLFGTAIGLGEGYIGLVLGVNSILVALLAVPVASRMERAGPFHFLGATALVIALAFACFAAVADPAAALLAGLVVFSFAELAFSSAVPAAVARLAPEGRRGAYQGTWALVSSLALGSALFVSSHLQAFAGWRATWWIYAAVLLAAAVALHALRKSFLAATGPQRI